MTRVLGTNPAAAEASLAKLGADGAAPLLCAVLCRERARVRRWRVRRLVVPAVAFFAFWVFPSYGVRKVYGDQFDLLVAVAMGALFAGGAVRRAVVRRADAATRPARHAALLLGELAPSLRAPGLTVPLRDALPTLALLRGDAAQQARAAVLIALARLLTPSLKEDHTT